MCDFIETDTSYVDSVRGEQFGSIRLCIECGIGEIQKDKSRRSKWCHSCLLNRRRKQSRERYTPKEKVSQCKRCGSQFTRDLKVGNRRLHCQVCKPDGRRIEFDCKKCGSHIVLENSVKKEIPNVCNPCKKRARGKWVDPPVNKDGPIS